MIKNLPVSVYLFFIFSLSIEEERGKVKAKKKELFRSCCCAIIRQTRNENPVFPRIASAFAFSLHGKMKRHMQGRAEKEIFFDEKGEIHDNRGAACMHAEQGNGFVAE